MTDAPPLKLEIFSDIACPWCFIGKRRLSKALLEGPGGPVEVRWRAFELQPHLPPVGVEAQPFYLAKFGGHARMQEAFDRVTQIGRAEDITFDFARMRRAPNTRLAHRAVKLCADRGNADAAVEALFAGHFEQGLDVSAPGPKRSGSGRVLDCALLSNGG